MEVAPVSCFLEDLLVLTRHGDELQREVEVRVPGDARLARAGGATSGSPFFLSFFFGEARMGNLKNPENSKNTLSN